MANAKNKPEKTTVLVTVLKNHVIYKGQKFEADKAYIDIYQRAKKSIYIVDDYVNIKTLHLLSHKKSEVAVNLFTENGHGRRHREASGLFRVSHCCGLLLDGTGIWIGDVEDAGYRIRLFYPARDCRVDHDSNYRHMLQSGGFYQVLTL